MPAMLLYVTMKKIVLFHLMHILFMYLNRKREKWLVSLLDNNNVAILFYSFEGNKKFWFCTYAVHEYLDLLIQWRILIYPIRTGSWLAKDAFSKWVFQAISNGFYR